MFGIDSQPKLKFRSLRFCGLEQRLKTLPLGEGVKHQVVGNFKNFDQIRFGIRGRVDMDLSFTLSSSIKLLAQLCFIQATGTNAGKIACR